ncbi:putative phosphoenolpyruvate carboxylase [Rosa chinensis]|uniref:Putative phosphoenolpyruvate carboxylase n=1 Tax=Rosa chinensis TaxID=74649 RepID=A0A2P6QZH5_ROSCH|nr:putative phosphoenolpyruvate carboxylase [Rosa chinensis]
MLVLLPEGKCLLCPRLEGPVSRSFWSQIKPPLRDLQLLLIELFLQSCGSGILADGGLDGLIRRVATFGMVLMKARLASGVLLFYCRS